MREYLKCHKSSMATEDATVTCLCGFYRHETAEWVSSDSPPTLAFQSGLTLERGKSAFTPSWALWSVALLLWTHMHYLLRWYIVALLQDFSVSLILHREPLSYGVMYTLVSPSYHCVLFFLVKNQIGLWSLLLYSDKNIDYELGPLSRF